MENLSPHERLLMEAQAQAEEMMWQQQKQQDQNDSAGSFSHFPAKDFVAPKTSWTREELLSKANNYLKNVKVRETKLRDLGVLTDFINSI